MSTRNNDAGHITWIDECGESHTKWFEKSTNQWGLANNLPYEIVFRYPDENGKFGERRCAKILKTVLYIAIDENDDGTAKLEKWNCKTVFYPD